MSKKNLMVFVIILALVCSAAFVAVNGAKIGEYTISPLRDQVKLGLDLEGGVFVVLEAKTDLTGTELAEKMADAKSIIDQRINGMGVGETNTTIEGDKRIRVELPGVDDVNKAIDIIGKTAELQFISLKEGFPEDTKPEDTTKYLLENGKVIVTGANVKDSKPQKQEDKVTGAREDVVALSFDEEGAKRFEDATVELSKLPSRQARTIYIVLDGEIISFPALTPGLIITDGQSVIQGSFTYESANELAMLIRGGALPVELEEVQSSVIGPTLGLESLDKSIFAAMIGLAIVFAFMIVFYRLPGFVADISLVIYILLLFGTMNLIGATLTLPGIAGIILSIGMAVDANVVIFERIKEEIRLGKSVRSSVESGFKRALTTVMDANITTLIAGIVLYAFGTGPIKGFAVTLIIGLIASLITAVFITRYLLKLLVGSSKAIAKNKSLFGVKVKEVA
jgi:preprotein translocase subunit SecD